MNLLRTDEQTIDDLGIFGKKANSGIYAIYNKANTHGGSALLGDMFRQPLSDKEAINRRSSIIECFAKENIRFPYHAALFDIMEKYLNYVEGGFGGKGYKTALGEKEIRGGVSAIMEIIRLTKGFIGKENIKNIEAYAEEREAVIKLLADPAFERVLEEQNKEKLSYSAITAYDALFRITEKRKLEQLLSHIYLLDVYISVGETATERKFVFPKALDKGTCELRLEGVYYPSLKKPVGNSIAMNAYHNVIFLTGANMAGKSTFLRSISTALYVAHIGFPVAAVAMDFSVMDGIYTTINLPDNLGIGASHFYAEVQRVKKMAEELSTDKAFFILFDELFRGTNVKDAHDATVAVISGFAGKYNSMFVISSHIVEAGEDLKRYDNISFFYMPTRMKNKVPEYTYKLEQGISDDRHGMIIIKNEGILETLKNGIEKSLSENTGFSIDKQTLEELNLLGKFRHGSVYHLFNRVKTRGGEQLLDKMFHDPLIRANDINKRCHIFRFFQEQNTGFPFDVQQVNLMWEYLDTGTSKNAVVAFVNTFIQKTLASLTRDERYKKTVQGLQAVITTLNKCYAFVQSISLADNNPYADQIRAAETILSVKQIEQLRATDIYQSLSVRTIAFYDHLLKGPLHGHMERILSFIYEVDVNIAVSDTARAKGFHYAKALEKEENTLSVQGIYHPCIEGAVGNDMAFNKNSNLLFLTGANMAGKSTLMKSVGIAMYLAHMGFPVAARQMEFSIREGIYSSINVADDIGLGYSHFYAEVVRVKQAAEAAAGGQRLLLMFDELFKGTNVKDAYDGTFAVTEAFAKYEKCLFIVSTHIIEVGEALQNTGNIQFAYMPTEMDGNRPRYTYRLTNGITKDRQGMMIIRNEGILELLN